MKQSTKYDSQCYVFLKLSLELGRWATGEPMNSVEKEEVLRLLILYESKYVPESLRIGYMRDHVCKSKSKNSLEVKDSILRFRS